MNNSNENFRIASIFGIQDSNILWMSREFSSVNSRNPTLAVSDRYVCMSSVSVDNISHRSLCRNLRELHSMDAISRTWSLSDTTVSWCHVNNWSMSVSVFFVCVCMCSVLCYLFNTVCILCDTDVIRRNHSIDCECVQSCISSHFFASWVHLINQIYQINTRFDQEISLNATSSERNRIRRHFCMNGIGLYSVYIHTADLSLCSWSNRRRRINQLT